MPNMNNLPEPLVIFHLGAAYIKATRECNALVKAHKLPFEIDHVQIILHLYYNPSGSSQQTISRELQRDKASVNRTVIFLSKINIVSIEKDLQDKRATLVKLTSFGIEMAEKIVTILKAYEESFNSVFTQEERIQLLGLLNKLIV
jgi:DNA-binding MarR family transcriptional regulator